jgi:hypothetical protein
MSEKEEKEMLDFLDMTPAQARVIRERRRANLKAIRVNKK